ncbi:beta-mannosidase [Halopelagius longus]|uniref:Beta-mannosidase B n=1 Tax=Halopelagius longus TaxID=1236180 RepID=A0A1H1FS27_9EURY|nr:glycoside hydrolase family 2 protein [Halopelagius longus]RDI70189.1 glycoside hydrolase family 2 protein [Halopelagius longus]SDR03737.1 beta-mannosidase [Halopelagius longus]
MQTRTLTGRWEFRSRGDDRRLPASVPGGVYSDLLAAGEIPDPYYADNELDLQWVGETDWVYERTVELDEAFLDEESVLLRCEGLDTVATVEVNGTVVGETANMHRCYEFDAAEALVTGENEIRVAFDSPVEYSRERAEAHDYEVPTLRYPVDQPGRNFIRKAQCHYGWDWGPCLPTVGIWRDIELVAFSDPRVECVKTEQTHRGDGDVDLSVTVGIDAPTAADTLVTASVTGATAADRVALQAGTSEVTLDLTVSDPDLWWPNGYGDQPLYELVVELTSPDRDAVHDARTERIGFRELSLRRDDDGDDGELFQFEVNGVPVFAKGANWIPVDALHGNVTEERYDDLLESAVDANMNMLRVWGGGYYEHDAFYDRCDELGVLVWQDFMFSCALYPADDDFLDSVEAEVRYQVRRLTDHPSLALWCGNNEIEMGLQSWFDGRNHLEDLYEDYETLFYDLFDSIVEEEDPTRTYWPGSPSSGTGRRDPYQEDKGDVHFWDVWHSGEPFEEYHSVEPRFVSEFGYQSFPSVSTLSDVVPEDQLNPTAPLMEHHQRHENGNGKILGQMTDYFRFPFSFDGFVYLSQVQQALAMKTAIEHWRRLKPYCTGTLYWQFNDLWQCASWSSVEYGGDWKALQHVARRIYAPVLLSTERDDDELNVWLTSDRREPLDGTVSVELLSFEGDVLATRRAEASVPALASESVLTVDIGSLVPDGRTDEVFVRATFDGADSHPAYAFFEEFKRLELPEPDVSVAVSGDELVLSTDAAALFVALDVPADGTFSDNYFHLVPGEEKTVRFDADDAGDVETTLRDDLWVTHVGATY